GRHRPVEEAANLVLSRRVRRDGRGAAAGLSDGPGNLFDPGRGPAGHQDMMAFGGEAPAQRGAQPVLGADADYDGGRPAHDATPLSTSSRMVSAAVCQPLAASPPKIVRLAAASSRWKGCGSNSAAKLLIRSGSTRIRPEPKVCPTAKSSK